MHRLFKLEREAEQRVHDARDREIDLGGPGSARRASEAMNAPMLEVAKIRKMRQRLGDKQMAIDHNSNLLQDIDRDDFMPPEVKSHQTRQVETKLSGLKADFKALDVEAEQKFFGGQPQVAEAVTKVDDDLPGVFTNPGSDRNENDRDLPPQPAQDSNERVKMAQKNKCEDLTPVEYQDLLNSHKAADNADRRILQKIDRLESRIQDIDIRLSRAEAERDRIGKGLGSRTAPSPPGFGDGRKRRRNPTGGRKRLLGEGIGRGMEFLDIILRAPEKEFAEYRRWSARVKRLQEEKAETERELVTSREERVRAREFLRVVSDRVREMGCNWSAGEWENALSDN